jgi:hypothetical protein
MASGWECPKCGLVLAPDVKEHRCDPPQAGHPAPVTPFTPPSSTGTYTWPGDVTITYTNTGAFTDAVVSIEQARKRLDGRGAA